MPSHLTERPPLPLGYKLIPVRTTYLEMRSRPETEAVPPPPGCAVERWAEPECAEYLELFSAVGGAWGWSGRLLMETSKLEAILLAATTEVHRLFCAGEAAGFVELDRSVPGQVEIAYFGLLPAFIGRGLGKFLLDWGIRRAWAGETARVWLHTCQYDHGGALAVYLKAGFRVAGEQIEMQPYAEEFLAGSRPASD
ncbi:MAG: GNAT family N-acetyltransferase [Acidobacteria bacterium]|nr:GNAT family N-acetyltransferase [Acidobacteriota bacterium]